MEPCPHRPPCPGCPRYGEPGIAPAAQAALDALARAHGLPAVRAVAGPAWGFRQRARLAVRALADGPAVGLFEAGTHRLVPVPRCRVHHPLVNEVADALRAALAESGVAAYDEARHAGIVRYLQVVVERSSGSAQCVLVANVDTPAALDGCVARLQERLGARLHSAWFNGNRGRGNAILGPHFERLSGPEAVVEHFGGPAIHYPPGAFGQNNLEVAAAIVQHLRALVPDGATVAEYYAGVGAIGLSLLDRCARLWLNEVGGHSLHGLALGLAALPAQLRARVQLRPGTAGEACADAPPADVVIVDPPRKGLDPPLLAHLVAAPPQRLLYVSCGLEAFLAEVPRLLAGGLRLAGLAAFDLMPYTGHVETVAQFERAAG